MRSLVAVHLCVGHFPGHKVRNTPFRNDLDPKCMTNYHLPPVSSRIIDTLHVGRVRRPLGLRQRSAEGGGPYRTQATSLEENHHNPGASPPEKVWNGRIIAGEVVINARSFWSHKRIPWVTRGDRLEVAERDGMDLFGGTEFCGSTVI